MKALMTKVSSKNEAVDNNEQEFTVENCEKMTILEMMEILAEESEGCGFSKEFLSKVETLASVLGKRLGLSSIQAILYSIFVDNYDSSNLTLADIRTHTGARLTRLAQYQGDVDALEQYRLIRRSPSNQYSNDGETCYFVPMDSIEALRNNRPYKQKVYKNVDFNVFARKMNEILRDRILTGLPYTLMAQELYELMENNKHLICVQELMKLYEDYNSSEWILMTVMCCVDLFHDNRFNVEKFLKKILTDVYVDSTRTLINDDAMYIQSEGYVEFYSADGLADTTRLVMTEKGRKLFLSEASRNKNTSLFNDDCLIRHESITEKTLFYDDEVKSQVDRLSTILEPKRFKEICNRLEQRGMRKGLCTLLWGYSGTGKTELVKQLSKQTGRNIISINVTDIQNKYVGESEKNIKEVFDNYRKALKSEPIEPILLFDEADQILAKRLENVGHSVDQMNNAIQGIILTEMQEFEGIMICTTNLVANIDSAFERRFLFKVRFDKPTVVVRQKIWHSMLPDIDDSVTEKLAMKYEFSGGQMDNVARKYVIDSILYGEIVNPFKALEGYCETECIEQKRRNKIGFAV